VVLARHQLAWQLSVHSVVLQQAHVHDDDVFDRDGRAEHTPWLMAVTAAHALAWQLTVGSQLLCFTCKTLFCPL
jgi:hypothetical protein